MPDNLVLPRLSPEFRTLCLALGAAALKTRTRDEVATALSGVERWDDLVEGVGRHRIASLIGPLIRSLRVPPVVSNTLREREFDNATRGLVHIRDLMRLNGLFRSAGLNALVLKGLPLSQQLYGNPLMRGVGDLDLLIAPAYFRDCHTLLLEQGYELLGGEAQIANEQVLRRIRDLSFRRPGGPVVELHQRLSFNNAVLNWSFEELWEHADRVEVQGQACFVLGPQHLAPYLAAHGAGHAWDRLCWLADLAVLLSRSDKPEDYRDLARAAGIAELFEHALALSDALLGTRLARGPRPGVRIHSRLFLEGRRWLDRPKRGTMAWFREETARRLWRVTAGGTLRFAWGEIIHALTNPVDWKVLHLPRGLAWLYPLLRPIGWIMRNFRLPR